MNFAIPVPISNFRKQTVSWVVHSSKMLSLPWVIRWLKNWSQKGFQLIKFAIPRPTSNFRKKFHGLCIHWRCLWPLSLSLSLSYIHGCYSDWRIWPRGGFPLIKYVIPIPTSMLIRKQTIPWLVHSLKMEAEKWGPWFSIFILSVNFSPGETNISWIVELIENKYWKWASQLMTFVFLAKFLSFHWL